MEVLHPDDPKSSGSTRRLTATVRALAVAAGVLLAAGLACAGLLPGAELGAALRWAGLALLLAWVARRRSLLLWTLWAMLAGAELGLDAPHVAAQTHLAADIFLRLIRMIVAPLIFGGIVTGIAGHDELRSVGRVAIKALIFFEVVTTLGLILGAAAIDISQAGVGVRLPSGAEAVPAAAHAAGWQDVVLNIVPENLALAVAQNQILQVAVFAVLFGVGLATLPPARRAPMVSVLQSLTEIMFRMTRIVMYLAPAAAGAALASTIGAAGLRTLVPLVKLVLTYYVGMAAFLALVWLPILWLARIRPKHFLAAISEPAALAFATTTSEAALPLAMEQMEAFGVPRWIVSFVIPTGYSFNMTGSSLFLSMAAIFAAQAAGIRLGMGEQIFMLATLMLTSKGVAGVPRAVLVILLGTADSFHIPVAAVLIILGVDAVMDMGRAAMNVAGNCMAAAVVARWTGELSEAAALKNVK